MLLRCFKQLILLNWLCCKYSISYRRLSNLTWGRYRQNNKSTLSSPHKSIMRRHYTWTCTHKQTDEAVFGTMKSLWLHHQNLPQIECLAGINFSLSASYHPTSIFLTPLSSQYAGVLAHRAACWLLSVRGWGCMISTDPLSVPPQPHFHPTPCRNHQGPLQSRCQRERQNRRAEPIFKNCLTNKDLQWPQTEPQGFQTSRYYVFSCKCGFPSE